MTVTARRGEARHSHGGAQQMGPPYAANTALLGTRLPQVHGASGDDLRTLEVSGVWLRWWAVPIAAVAWAVVIAFGDPSSWLAPEAPSLPCSETPLEPERRIELLTYALRGGRPRSGCSAGVSQAADVRDAPS